MNGWFQRFANWAKRRIASPRHLVGFLIVSVLWLVWALSRDFDPFSQLVLNTPTTWAEYLFEILVLASAIGAEEAAQSVLVHIETVLERQQQRIDAEDERAERLEQKLDQVLAILSRSGLAQLGDHIALQTLAREMRNP